MAPAPKIGVAWKSLRIDSARHRFYSPFDLWAPILTTPGAQFVNLQYGECGEELQEARRRFGVEIWSPPGINLKDDLDELAALSCALDLVIGPANATTNIAAACGAPTWLISTPSWPRLGSDRYPWYPTVTVFSPQALGEWEPVMAEVAQALAARVQS